MVYEGFFSDPTAPHCITLFPLLLYLAFFVLFLSSFILRYLFPKTYSSHAHTSCHRRCVSVFFLFLSYLFIHSFSFILAFINSSFHLNSFFLFTLLQHNAQTRITKYLHFSLRLPFSFLPFLYLLNFPFSSNPVCFLLNPSSPLIHLLTHPLLFLFLIMFYFPNSYLFKLNHNLRSALSLFIFLLLSQHFFIPRIFVSHPSLASRFCLPLTKRPHQ